MPSQSRIKLTERHVRARLAAFLSRSSRDQTTVRSLVQALNEQIGAAVLFGGMVRDIARGGSHAFKSDFDIVVDCDDDTVLNRFLTARMTRLLRNRFGGYRFNVGLWDVDVWALPNTWAYRNGHVVPSSLDNLIYTTFFDWDGIAYNTANHELMLLPGYFQRLSSGVLDMSLAANPNPAGIVVRSMRWIVVHNARLSPRLVRHLVAIFETTTPYALWRMTRSWPKAAQVQYTPLAVLSEQLKRHLDLDPESPFPRDRSQLPLPGIGR